MVTRWPFLYSTHSPGQYKLLPVFRQVLHTVTSNLVRQRVKGRLVFKYSATEDNLLSPHRLGWERGVRDVFGTEQLTTYRLNGMMLGQVGLQVEHRPALLAADLQVVRNAVRRLNSNVQVSRHVSIGLSSPVVGFYSLDSTYDHVL